MPQKYGIENVYIYHFLIYYVYGCFVCMKVSAAA